MLKKIEIKFQLIYIINNHKDFKTAHMQFPLEKKLF